MARSKLIMLSIALFSLLFVSGCQDFGAWLEGRLDENPVSDANASYQSCPVCESQGAGAGTISYFFDDEINNGLNQFVDFPSTQLACSFVVLEDKTIANNLMNIHNSGVDVRLFFDKTSTFMNCDTGCIPRVESFYTELYAAGLNVGTGDTHSNYCVNDQGLFIFSKSLNSIPSKDYGLAIYNSKLREIYLSRFNTMFG